MRRLKNSLHPVGANYNTNRRKLNIEMSHVNCLPLCIKNLIRISACKATKEQLDVIIVRNQSSSICSLAPAVGLHTNEMPRSNGIRIWMLRRDWIIPGRLAIYSGPSCSRTMCYYPDGSTVTIYLIKYYDKKKNSFFHRNLFWCVRYRPFIIIDMIEKAFYLR